MYSSLVFEILNSEIIWLSVTERSERRGAFDLSGDCFFAPLVFKTSAMLFSRVHTIGNRVLREGMNGTIRLCSKPPADFGDPEPEKIFSGDLGGFYAADR